MRSSQGTDGTEMGQRWDREGPRLPQGPLAPVQLSDALPPPGAPGLTPVQSEHLSCKPSGPSVPSGGTGSAVPALPTLGAGRFLLGWGWGCSGHRGGSAAPWAHPPEARATLCPPCHHQTCLPSWLLGRSLHSESWQQTPRLRVPGAISARPAPDCTPPLDPAARHPGPRCGPSWAGPP